MTIEIKKGENPLTLSQLKDIYEKVEKIIDVILDY